MTPEEQTGHRLVSEVVLRIYAQWIRFHIALLFIWGLWVTSVATFTTSSAFNAFARLGTEQAVGVPVAIIAVICLLAVRADRRRLMAIHFILGAVVAGIALLFILGSWRSTGVPIYSLIALGHGVAVVHMSGMSDPEVD